MSPLHSVPALSGLHHHNTLYSNVSPTLTHCTLMCLLPSLIVHKGVRYPPSLSRRSLLSSLTVLQRLRNPQTLISTVSPTLTDSLRYLHFSSSSFYLPLTQCPPRSVLPTLTIPQRPLPSLTVLQGFRRHRRRGRPRPLRVVCLQHQRVASVGPEALDGGLPAAGLQDGPRDGDRRGTNSWITALMQPLVWTGRLRSELKISFRLLIKWVFM